ncbi:MAG: hypothetical protein ABI468_05495, partial [Candidatus Nanopelagicales bacterium]
MAPRSGLRLVSSPSSRTECGPLIAADPPTAGVTLGALLHDSGRLVQNGAELLGTTRLPSRSAAFAAVLALSDTLRACHELLEVLSCNRLRPELEQVGTNTEVGANTDLLRWGNRFESLLAPYGRRPVAVAVGPARDSRSALESTWCSAAVSVRSASDMLRTHRDTDGSWRSPESAALDETGEVLSAIGAVACQVRMLASCCRELARQARVFGIGATMVGRQLGDPGELIEVAQRCGEVMPPLRGQIAGLGLARPSVRLDLSTSQVAGRLARLRRTAWVLSRRTHVPAGTLADYATLAITLQESGPDAGSRANPGSVHHAWQVIAHILRDVRTASRALAGVRGDVALVQWMLGRCDTQAACADAVRAARETLPELARWNAQSLARAATAHELYLRAAALDGHEVSDCPELVAAKLADRIVPVPHDRLVRLAAAYATAAGASSEIP